MEKHLGLIVGKTQAHPKSLINRYLLRVKRRFRGKNDQQWNKTGHRFI